MKKPMKFRANDSGAIEGLPLQLLIMVIIAGVGIGIVVGWMSFSKTEVGSITVKPDTITVSKVVGNSTDSFIVTVLDQNGKALNNAIITLTGCGSDTAKRTESNGSAYFVVTSTLPANINTGTITVEAQYDSTWGKTTKTTTILVVRSST